MIKITDVYIKFDTQKVLQGINLQIETGETIAIIGKSGCGKSVLLKVIVALLWPDRGLVNIDGKTTEFLSEKDLYEVRRRFGFLFQGAALFDSMTVEENIALPIIENDYDITELAMKKKIAEKLELVELPGIEKLKPSELSGGMRKRVGLARALITEPDYILYDEPTTGLDPISSDNIDSVIKQLSQQLNATSIVVTHDMFTVKNIVDRVAMLHQGKIYFDGTPKQLLESKDKVIDEFIKRTE